MEKIKVEEIYNELHMLYKDAKCALNYYDSYSLLISIILSAQTTDKAVNKVTPLLFSKYKDFKALMNATPHEVEVIIKEIGLYRNKASNIISASKKLVQDGYDYVPNNFEYLISLPGVGRKTANVFLAEYYGEQTFGVDTHISRVSKRLGLSKANSSVIQIEKDLAKAFKDYSYKEIHHLLIYFGRYMCIARNPKCDICPFKDRCNKCAF